MGEREGERKEPFLKGFVSPSHYSLIFSNKSKVSLNNLQLAIPPGKQDKIHLMQKKTFIYLVAFCLAAASQATAQQDSVAVDTSAAADTVGAEAAEPDSIAPARPGSTAAPDSLSARADTVAAGPEASDSASVSTPRKSARSAAKPQGPARKPPSSPGALPMEVIDWDWDDYAHPTAVGFRHLDTGREYELEHNDVYTEIWERQKGQRLWVWGQSKDLGDGFWGFTPEKFELLLTIAAADSIALADSIARVDSIARADSMAVADSIALVDSIAAADSLAALTDSTQVPAAGANAPRNGPGTAPPATAPQNGPPANAPRNGPGAAPAAPPVGGGQSAPPAGTGKPPAAADSTKRPPQAGTGGGGGP